MLQSVWISKASANQRQGIYSLKNSNQKVHGLHLYLEFLVKADRR